MKEIRRVFSKSSLWITAGIVNLVIAAMIVAPLSTGAAPEDKITICHATSSHTNPYVENQPDRSGDVHGHDGHDGPIWFSGITGDWGDIIPPFDYEDSAGITQHYAGKNWTQEGQDILANGCNMPAAAPTTGTLIVHKVVSGGSADADDFLMHVQDDTDTEVTNSPQEGSTTGTNYTLEAGDYSVSETGGPTGYTASFSSSCTGGNVTVTASQSVTCTVTNTFSSTPPTTGTLIVQKVVSGGTASASDFSMHVEDSTDNDVTGSPQPGDTTGDSYTLAPGTYSVSETGGPSNYTASFSSSCTGGNVTVTAGQTVTCTVTNTFADATPNTIQVHIAKYLDGDPATASSANSFAFPMSSSWNATNIGPGNGTYDLGPTGFNNPNAYQASTAEMSLGATYTTSETTSTTSGSVLPANAPCEAGKYRLVGYQTGNSFNQAEAATSSTTAPALTNIQSDRFIIVSNETCPAPSNAADVGVTKTVSDDNPDTGDDITYTITVTNNSGSNSALNVNVNDLLPAGTAFISSVVSTGSYNNTTGVWTIGTMTTGATATLSIVADVTADNDDGPITNTATVSSTNDNNAANNSDSADFTVGTVDSASSSSGSGGSRRNNNNDDDDDEGQVLGESTDVPFAGGLPFPGGIVPEVLGESVGDVLGEETALPRTGIAVGVMLFALSLLGIPLLRRDS